MGEHAIWRCLFTLITTAPRPNPPTPPQILPSHLLVLASQELGFTSPIRKTPSRSSSMVTLSKSSRGSLSSGPLRGSRQQCRACEGLVCHGKLLLLTESFYFKFHVHSAKPWYLACPIRVQGTACRLNTNKKNVEFDSVRVAGKRISKLAVRS